MSGITQCPQCATRFKVTQAQLEAHRGLVRCGRCQHVFDARPQRKSGTPPASASGQPALPGQEETRSAAAAPAPSQLGAIQVAAEPEAVGLNAPSSHAYTGAWRVGMLFALLLLLGQSAYFFRVELAARLPGLGPALVTYCDFLGCSVPLPHREDLMSIESSDLVASPTQASLVTVNALLRNRASYVQALPHLQLTLTDGQNKPLARRSFSPEEYLRAGQDAQAGLSSGRELDVGLHLDTTDLNPVGYRLLLFYPEP